MPVEFPRLTHRWLALSRGRDGWTRELTLDNPALEDDLLSNFSRFICQLSQGEKLLVSAAPAVRGDSFHLLSPCCLATVSLMGTIPGIGLLDGAEVTCSGCVDVERFEVGPNWVEPVGPTEVAREYLRLSQGPLAGELLYQQLNIKVEEAHAFLEKSHFLHNLRDAALALA